MPSGRPITRPALRALLLLAWSLLALGAQADGNEGAAIYRQGLLPSGANLRGTRAAALDVQGMAAACINCHRASGLGSTEGRIVVPPIIGKYLFRSHATNVQDMTAPHVAGYRSTRPPYTEESLAQAIRQGVTPNGRSLNYLMPRYPLDDASMAALIAYLKGLSAGEMPGVSADTLHFATIITPDADPRQRRAMLDVMEQFFADKNAFIRGGLRPMRSTREIEYRVSRRWQLHVWELTGAPQSWEQQLRMHMAAEPVFAVISGLGGKTWAPVHRFCEAARVPCLLPNVELPLVDERDFYPVYFSRGVLLEVDMLAGVLSGKEVPRRLVQVYRAGDVGEAAARALAVLAAASGIAVENRALPELSGSAAELADATRHLDAGDALMLWLRAPDLAALAPDARPPSTLLVSGTMGDLEHAPLPLAWREAALLTYPVDLPEQRSVRMNFPLSWFRIKKIAVVDERVQTDTYIACGILADTLTDMLDSFVPEYLVERVEGMVEHRLVNGYYARLSLASGQRFASKGGYLVRFDGPTGSRVRPQGEWVVP